MVVYWICSRFLLESKADVWRERCSDIWKLRSCEKVKKKVSQVVGPSIFLFSYIFFAMYDFNTHTAKCRWACITTRVVPRIKICRKIHYKICNKSFDQAVRTHFMYSNGLCEQVQQDSDKKDDVSNLIFWRYLYWGNFGPSRWSEYVTSFTGSWKVRISDHTSKNILRVYEICPGEENELALKWFVTSSHLLPVNLKLRPPFHACNRTTSTADTPLHHLQQQRVSGNGKGKVYRVASQLIGHGQTLINDLDIEAYF
jgi:hypothetical protein